MLYPHASDPEPSRDLFRVPTAEYRATPFWAWNCDLDPDLLLREIGYMKQMGMGGFHMHTRCGMSVKYLSEPFMDRIRLCVKEAEKQDMLAWLYDEDKWPSGFAGGYVTEKEENRQKMLLFTPRSPEEPSPVPLAHDTLLAIFGIRLDPKGRLAAYRRLTDPASAAAGETVWYARVIERVPTAWFHFNGYVDTMNPAAIRDFIRITHEAYKAALGDDFGSRCPAIFTDEPQMPRKTSLSRSDSLQDIILSWTPDLPETYFRTYGEDLTEKLPELIWERAEGVSVTRWRYHDHVTERFVSAYCDQIGDWCRENGILMTGHMMDEATLESQTLSVGETMRAYRAFTLPGVDLLCDGHEYNTLKQSASAAHQQGCPGVISELYGVTNWDFDFKGHKLQGDWQAALGVTVRVPHLYWCSMHGESKRDYPASIGHQSSWWREYPFIEDHFARVATLMTRGLPLIRVGVIHPIESYWLAYGPNDLTGAKRREMDRRFAQLTEWLLFETVDFDFICESSLPRMEKQEEKAPLFRVGEMAYDAVIVPSCDTLRESTLDALRDFRDRGGTVLFLGTVPEYMNAVPSDRPARLAERCVTLPWDKARLFEALEPFREIRIETGRGLPSDNLLCALRSDGSCRNLFITHANAENRLSPAREESYRITLRGCWTAERLDTLTGEVTPFPVTAGKDVTVLRWTCWNQDSLLLRLTPGADSDSLSGSASVLNGSYGISMSEEFSLAGRPENETILPPPEKIILHEENVCVLDKAEWTTNEEPIQPAEDMLRVGVLAKQRLGISTATVTGAQPWILPPEKAEHTVTVRTQVFSEIELPEVFLAMENPEVSTVLFNGQPVDPGDARGWFADESIVRIKVGPLLKGINTVEVRKPLTASTCTENILLLGAFGVRVTGTKVTLTDPPVSLEYGDWTQQGLPFYSGPLTYRYTLEGGRDLKLRLGLFSAPCVTAELDGKRIANLSLSPSEADLGHLSEGPHTLDITVYASRINTFGALHLNDAATIWFGPDSWRTSGPRWTDLYRLKPSGLLSEPRLFTVTNEK